MQLQANSNKKEKNVAAWWTRLQSA